METYHDFTTFPKATALSTSRWISLSALVLAVSFGCGNDCYNQPVAGTSGGGGTALGTGGESPSGAGTGGAGTGGTPSATSP
jgi:hypothetical protein